ncbi:hypothetical protein EVAR_63274_1 [Eumeta japonica]|uniref:Uncharacterized protein n=1 Tax=Eumeta variegata TaxID=151549 RepID=A0A4C1Z0E1_EUMVA|nr:hypothetical protein EVAR_63274_1 [Eumeta japonica]
MSVLATPCENGYYGSRTNKSWHLIKKARKNSEKSCTHVSRDDDGHLLNEEKNYFESVFASEDTFADDDVTAAECMIDGGNESEITMDEIKKVLKLMEVGKAAGYDRVSSEMLRGDGGIVASLLYQLFNKCWESRKALQSLYRGSSAYVRINGTYADWFDDRRSVRQGCIASSLLFNLFMNIYSYNLKEYECGLRMDELSVKCLLYADVLRATGDSKMNDSVKKRGMKVNVGTTKVMVFERGESTSECNILIKGWAEVCIDLGRIATHPDLSISESGYIMIDFISTGFHQEDSVRRIPVSIPSDEPPHSS